MYVIITIIMIKQLHAKSIDEVCIAITSLIMFVCAFSLLQCRGMLSRTACVLYTMEVQGRRAVFLTRVKGSNLEREGGDEGEGHTERGLGGREREQENREGSIVRLESCAEGEGG